MKRVLILDGGNLSFRCFVVMYEASGTLCNTVGVPTTVIFGMLRMLYAYAEKDVVDECVICWDGGSKYRKKLWPHYKGNREKQPWSEEYYAEMDTARKYFDKMGIKQMRVRGIEADDLIGYLSRYYRERGDRVTVFSDDKDFFQLGSLGINLYRPTKQELIDDVEMENRLGYPTKWLPKIVALCGEAKDNIPGIGGIDENNIIKKVGMGPATAAKLLIRADGTCRTFAQALEAMGAKSKMYGHFKNNFDTVRIAYLLSRIRTKEEQYKKWELAKIDEEMGKILTDRTVTRSMLSQIGEFLEFKNLNLYKLLNKIGVKVK